MNWLAWLSWLRSALRLRPSRQICACSNLRDVIEIAADSLRGRVFEISLGDLNKDAHELAWRKVRVQCEEVKGYDCYTN